MLRRRASEALRRLQLLELQLRREAFLFSVSSLFLPSLCLQYSVVMWNQPRPRQRHTYCRDHRHADQLIGPHRPIRVSDWTRLPYILACVVERCTYVLLIFIWQFSGHPLGREQEMYWRKTRAIFVCVMTTKQMTKWLYRDYTVFCLPLTFKTVLSAVTFARYKPTTIAIIFVKKIDSVIQHTIQPTKQPQIEHTTNQTHTTKHIQPNTYNQTRMYNHCNCILLSLSNLSL